MSAKTPAKTLTGENILIVGCGYLGTRVALAAHQSGANVHATTRSSAKAQQLAEKNIRPILFNWNDRRTLPDLGPFGRILVAVSYDASGPHSRYQSQVGGLRNLLAVVPDHADLCYISTTGVYHQANGCWVDENSPAKPTREGGRAHLDAESLLHRHRPNLPWTILRLSGIYGPGRVPRAADVVAGRPIRSAKDGYLNLIHVDDAATAVLATWQNDCDRLYVVSDDQPIVRANFYREIAGRCRVAPPVFESPDASSPVAMRSAGNKRVWNRRMKSHLVPRLQFPTYREGLADVLKDLGK
ncbi:MAG: SDR family oxidoreductase [Pirellulaceae bacterium]